MYTFGKSDKFIEAYVFAETAHMGQKRKYTYEPYFNHPANVSLIVSSVNHTNEMLIAALLHDTVEDTEITIEDIRYKFGYKVAVMVKGLTDISKPEDGNRKARKEIDKDYLANQGSRVKTIKLADLIDNSKSIIKHDPKFAKVYMQEKKELLEVLKDGDEWLWFIADSIVKKYEGLNI